MTDCIVIGSGPAGISAVLTLKARGVDFLLLGESGLSEKIKKAERITNYPGLFAVSGADFSARLSTQLQNEGISVKNERAVAVYAMEDYFSVQTGENGFWDAKTVILAVGTQTQASIEGEKEFAGLGVSYCATCDGGLYRGKTVTVLSYSKKYEKEAVFLSSIAKKTLFVPFYKDYEPIKNAETFLSRPLRIEGRERVEKIVFSDEEYQTDAVFILKDALPFSALCAGLETKDGAIVVDRSGKTNLKGLFACGDCTGRPYQYAKAVGEGNVCAHSVLEYLEK